MNVTNDARTDSTLDRALRILYHCAAHHDGSSFSQLKTLCGGIAATTLTRILKPLLAGDDLKRMDGLYYSGPCFINAARQATQQQNLDEIAQPIVQCLADLTQESAAYFHWDQEWMYLRLKHEVAENFHYTTIGSRQHPAEHTFFRSILAHVNKKEHRRLGIEYQEHIYSHIIENGYYTQKEKYRCPIFRITAPIYCSGKICGAIGITSLIPDLKTQERSTLIKHVRTCAEQLNDALRNTETRT